MKKKGNSSDPSSAYETIWNEQIIDVEPTVEQLSYPEKHFDFPPSPRYNNRN